MSRRLGILALLLLVHLSAPALAAGDLDWNVWIFDAEHETLWEGQLPTTQAHRVELADGVGIDFSAPTRDSWTPPGGDRLQQRLVRRITVSGLDPVELVKQTGGFAPELIGPTWIPGGSIDYGLQSIHIQQDAVTRYTILFQGRGRD